MTSTAGSVFCKVLEPTERVGNWFAILGPFSGNIPRGQFEPVTDNPFLMVDRFHEVSEKDFREIHNPVEVRNTPSLPFSHPVKANHAHAVKALQESSTEAMPVGMSLRAIFNCEGEGEADTIETVKGNGLQETGVTSGCLV